MTLTAYIMVGLLNAVAALILIHGWIGFSDNRGCYTLML